MPPPAAIWLSFRNESFRATNTKSLCNTILPAPSAAAPPWTENPSKSGPVFYVPDNRPAQQSGILYRNDYLILCNPAPIFDRHFTVVSLEHQPQEITSSLSWLLQLAADASPDYTVFYNGPACGASAPDHLHFQMIPADALPYLNELKDLPPVKETVCRPTTVSEKSLTVPLLFLESKNAEDLQTRFLQFIENMPKNVVG